MTSAVSNTLRQRFGQYYLEDIPYLIVKFGREWILPIGIAVSVVGGVTKLLARLKKLINPPPPRIRHEEAKFAYAKGRVDAALVEWSALKDYGPSYLSRACHEIYVNHKPKAGLQILKEARDRGIGLNKKAVESMKDDSKAIESNHTIMVDMNARTAKQDYLGVTTL